MGTRLLFSKPIISEFETKELSFNEPVIIPNKILMSPGIWNEIEYSAESVQDAYLHSDFSNKETISLWLDHKDELTDMWAGYVRNIRLEGDNVIGDLEIWDENSANKLTKAKAKFGISPKLRTQEDSNHKAHSFVFENFSIVTRPAVKTAYINLKYKMTQEEEKNTIEAEKENEVQELQEKEEPKKKPEEEPKEEENKELSAYSDFMKNYLKEHKGATIAEAAEAWKKENEGKEMSEVLSELPAILEKALSILKCKKKYPYPEEKKENSEVKELKEEIEKLKEKINEPDKKTIELAATSAGINEKYSPEKMVAFLRGNAEKVSASIY